MKKNISLTKMLLNSKAIDMHRGNECNETALHLAARFNNGQVAEILLADGKIDVNRLNGRNQTAFHAAIFSNAVKVLPLLFNTSIDMQHRVVVI